MSTMTTNTPPTDRIPLRKRFGKLFKKLTTPRAPATRSRVRPIPPAHNDQFHYVISSVQEDEIRESFLVEKLRGYTQSLSESDFESIMMDSNDADSSIAESSPPKDDEDDSEAENGFIFVPFPGTKHPGTTTTDDSEKLCRKVPNSCAVCLSSFEPEDRITWSSNKECTHVFHGSCIIDWLNTSGRRHLRRRRRQGQQEGVLNYANDPLRKITKFPMPCPCCRQVFALCAEVDDEAEERPTVEPTLTPEPAVAHSAVNDAHAEEQLESAEAADESSDESDGPSYATSCVELASSDEAVMDDDACSTDSTPSMTALPCPIVA